VTIPKSVADAYGIREGDELEFLPAGEAIRVVRASSAPAARDVAERLALFDAATERQRARQAASTLRRGTSPDRGWTRDELYTRGRTR
jgi:bifunctional DNA-binding transcriptional regulator/antitoxin component of YhaV-PrlF toxin-antitoxin module